MRPHPQPSLDTKGIAIVCIRVSRVAKLARYRQRLEEILQDFRKHHNGFTIRISIPWTNSENRSLVPLNIWRNIKFCRTDLQMLRHEREQITLLGAVKGTDLCKNDAGRNGPFQEYCTSLNARVFELTYLISSLVDLESDMY